MSLSKIRLELARCKEHPDGARVSQDPLDLLGAGSLVDRHGNSPRVPQCVVGESPLVPCAGHDAHAVPHLDPAGGDAFGHLADIVGELLVGHILPACSDGKGDGGLVGGYPLALEQMIGQVAFGGR